MWDLFRANIQIILVFVFLLMMIVLILCVARSKILHQFLLDDSTKLSMGRLLCFLVTIAYIFYAGFLAITKGNLPDIPLTVAGLITALYAANKFSPTTPFKPPGGQP